VKIAGAKANFHAVIEVPRKTDLRVRMSSGGLSIGDVKGNKDIEILAGNLDQILSTHRTTPRWISPSASAMCMRLYPRR
jgi:hypothetical protein